MHKLSVKIRKFKIADANSLSALIRKTIKVSNGPHYAKKYINILVKWNSPENLIEKSKRRKIFVAVKNNILVGTVGLDKDRITSVFVSPLHQFKGIGKMLLRRAERAAKKAKIKKIWTRASVNAVGFYQKQGYQKVRKMHNKFAGPVILMKKNLVY